jgi:hypothetical protein
LCLDRDGSSLKAINFDGTGERLIVPQNGAAGAVHSAAWSPDGKRLVVTLYDEKLNEKGERYGDNDMEAMNFRLVVMDADGNNRRQVELKDAKVVVFNGIDWR